MPVVAAVGEEACCGTAGRLSAAAGDGVAMPAMTAAGEGAVCGVGVGLFAAVDERAGAVAEAAAEEEAAKAILFASVVTHRRIHSRNPRFETGL